MFQKLWRQSVSLLFQKISRTSGSPFPIHSDYWLSAPLSFCFLPLFAFLDLSLFVHLPFCPSPILLNCLSVPLIFPICISVPLPTLHLLRNLSYQVSRKRHFRYFQSIFVSIIPLSISLRCFKSNHLISVAVYWMKFPFYLESFTLSDLAFVQT